MLKETIQFTDFNEQPQVTVEYFNLSKNEVIELEKSIEGGLAAMMRRVEDNPTAASVLDLLKVLSHASYGQKSDDGKYFDKSPEITNRFIRSAYYDDFLFSLVENDGAKGLAFIRGILPASLVAEAEKQISSGQAALDYQPDAREAFARAQAQQATPVVQQPVAPSAFQPAPAPVVQVAQPPIQETAPGTTAGNEIDIEAFRAWQAQQTAQQATPDAYRVPAEEQPMQGLPRPPHEQAGPAQP